MIYKLIAILLIVRLASAFSFEAWSEHNFLGNVKTYTTKGSFSPGFVIKSYRWDSPPASDDCCVRMCNGQQDVGYWCVSHSNGTPSSDFNKIIIGCGSDKLVC